MIQLEDRFSYAELVKLGRNSSAAQERCDELNAVVESFVYGRLPEIMGEVVAELNRLGHRLEPHSSDDASLWYADIRHEGTKERWWLRLSVDVIASSGFPHFEDDPTLG